MTFALLGKLWIERRGPLGIPRHKIGWTIVRLRFSNCLGLCRVRFRSQSRLEGKIKRVGLGHTSCSQKLAQLSETSKTCLTGCWFIHKARHCQRGILMSHCTTYATAMDGYLCRRMQISHWTF